MNTLQELALTAVLRAPIDEYSLDIPGWIRLLLLRRIEADHRSRFALVLFELRDEIGWQAVCKIYPSWRFQRLIDDAGRRRFTAAPTEPADVVAQRFIFDDWRHPHIPAFIGL